MRREFGLGLRSFPWVGARYFFSGVLAVPQCRQHSCLRGGDVTKRTRTTELFRWPRRKERSGLGLCRIAVCFDRRGARRAAAMSLNSRFWRLLSRRCGFKINLIFQPRRHLRLAGQRPCSGMLTRFPRFYKFPAGPRSSSSSRPIALEIVAIWAVLIPVRRTGSTSRVWPGRREGIISAALPHFREAVRLNSRIEIYQSERANAARSAGLWDEAWTPRARSRRPIRMIRMHGTIKAWERCGWFSSPGGITGRMRKHHSKKPHGSTRFSSTPGRNLPNGNTSEGIPQKKDRIGKKSCRWIRSIAMARQILGIR